MGSSFGKNIKISIFGESHSYCVGLTIDGLKAGIYIDQIYLENELKKRKTHDDLSTSRNEEDKIIFLSGIFNNYTTGGPLTFILENNNQNSSSYQKGIIRPSHSDLTSFIKYNGFNDYRGGGMFSGRMTSPIIVLGALIKQILNKQNIYVYSHISSIGKINDDKLDLNNLNGQIMQLNKSSFSTFNEEKGELMKEEIRRYKQNNNSIGGTIETFITGIKIGLGEPFFDSVESYISHLIFSIGGIKGIIFGNENVSTMSALEYNDQIRYDNGIKFLSNNNGGINGGISNGDIIYFKTFIKPTPSILAKQNSINIIDKENIELKLNGRFDPCIVHRIRPVIDALTYYAIYDLMGNEHE